jgi:DNA-binding transcriptional regulator YhcF (GntR family)
MAKSAYQPAFKKAYSWVIDKIRDGTIAVGQRMPPVRKLAAACNVNARTILAVQKKLREEGIIAGAEGARPKAIAHPETKDATVFPAEDLQVDLMDVRGKVRVEILQAITNGTFALDKPLPSIKELCTQFSTSAATIRAVLEELYRENHVIVKRRKYYVRPSVSPKSRNTIVLIGIAYSLEYHRGLVMGEHDQAFCSLFNLECARRNLSVEIVKSYIKSASTMKRGHNESTFVPDKEPLSYVLLLSQVPTGIDTLLSQLGATGKPVAVIDVAGGKTPATYTLPKGNFQVFRFSSGYSAAREITRTLIQYGHRHFAYVSPYNQHDWSLSREEGIKAQLAASGIDYAFSTIGFEIWQRLHELYDIQGFAFDADPKAIEMRLVEAFKNFPPSIVENFSGSFAATGTRASMARGQVHPLVIDALSKFKQLDTTTAWIAVNDVTAFAILDYFWQNRIRVPAQASVASFDDTHQALSQGLCSYNFNVTGLVSSALSYIIQPRIFRAAKNAIRMEVPGVFVQRHTTGVVRKLNKN